MKKIMFDYFKRFGLIDILGIGLLTVILSVAMFFFLRKADYVTIELKISQSDVMGEKEDLPLWYLENVKKGLKQSDIFGRANIEIENIYHYLVGSSTRQYYVKMKLRCVYDKKTGVYSYDGMPLLLGSYHTFKMGSIMIRGVVQGFDEKKEHEEKVLLVRGLAVPDGGDGANTIASGIQIYIADLIKNGLEMKDSDGKVIATVKNINKKPATREFIYQNRLVKVYDDTRQVVTMDVELHLEKFGDLFLFRKDYNPMVGSILYLDFIKFGVPVVVLSVD